MEDKKRKKGSKRGKKRKTQNKEKVEGERPLEGDRKDGWLGLAEGEGQRRLGTNHPSEEKASSLMS